MAGRPTKYTDKVLAEFAVEIEKIADDYNSSKVMFHISRVAINLGFLPDYFDDFSKKSESFSLALKRLKVIQECNFADALIRNGSNTTGIIFSMKNCCGWRDKREVEHTGKVLILDDEE